MKMAGTWHFRIQNGGKVVKTTYLLLFQVSKVVVVGMAPELTKEMVIWGCIIKNTRVLNFKMDTEW